MVFYWFQSVVQLDMSILLTNQPLGIMMLNKDLYIFVIQPDLWYSQNCDTARQEGWTYGRRCIIWESKEIKTCKVYNRLYSMIQDGRVSSGQPASLRTGAGPADGCKPHDPAQGSGSAAGGPIWSSTYAVRETSSANAIPAPVCRAWRSHSTRSAVLCPDPLTRQRWNFA